MICGDAPYYRQIAARIDGPSGGTFGFAASLNGILIKVIFTPFKESFLKLLIISFGTGNFGLFLEEVARLQ